MRGAGVGRPGVARGAVERGAAEPLAGGEETWLVSALEALWRDGLCAPGNSAARARVDSRLRWQDWTDSSSGSSGLARAARGCLACPVSASSVCGAVMTRIAQSTGHRIASVAVAGSVIPWKGAVGDELVARSAGWSRLPLRVIGEEVAS